jgi:ATP-binding cassette subfamily F protein uup
MALALDANLIVLDEPTNDLDLETLELLQELLADYPGTVILVSHDRDFLDRVATSVIASEGNGRWQNYAGGYSDMVAQRGAGVEKRADRPAVTAPRAASATPRGMSREKLSSNEQHLLRTLPGRMETLNQQIATLRGSLDDPGLYPRDPARFADLSKRLARYEAELAEAEETWLSIELRRETLEAGA